MDASDLRTRAEEIVAVEKDWIPEDLESYSYEKICQVLHNLYVHQIELELQNEELIQAQFELEESRESYFEIYDLAPIGYLTILDNGIIQETNLTAANILGTTRNFMVQKPLTQFIFNEDQDVYYLYKKFLFDSFLNQGNQETLKKDCEIRMIRPDKTVFWSNITATLFKDKDKNIKLRLVISDITQRKKSDDALNRLNDELNNQIQSAIHEIREKDLLLIAKSRQASLGEMISNIAHQWRQPLNNLGIHVQKYKIFYESGKLDLSEINHLEDKAMKQILYMSQTIDDFRNFFKPDKIKTRFYIGSIIQKTINLIGHSLVHHQIVLKLILDKDTEIEGFPNEYGQVLINIVTNAKEILVENKIENPVITIHATQKNGKSKVTITDNGGGISPKAMDKIFEPYFTTKEQGTGIGLFMSKMIIEKYMGGTLTAANIDNGAVFQITI